MEQLILRSRANYIMNWVFQEARCCWSQRVKPKELLGFEASYDQDMYVLIIWILQRLEIQKQVGKEIQFEYKSLQQHLFVAQDIFCCSDFMMRYKRNITKMIDNFVQHCKDQKHLFQSAQLILIEQTEYQHGDFLTLGLLLDALGQEKKVTFIAFRENYAHFLGLSKKVGKPIEGYLKNKQLTYIQCFQSEFCSQLPLLQTQPPTYVPPPSLIQKLYIKDLIKTPQIFTEDTLVVVDSISYIQQKVDLCFWLYEQAMLNNCRIILGGCSDNGEVTEILEQEAELVLRLENDVGGYGRVNVIGGNSRKSVMWKNTNGKVEFSHQIKI